MTRLIVLVILTIFAYLGYISKKRHMILFNAIWILSSVINWICADYIYTPSDFALICIILFVVFTNIGFMVGEKIVLNNRNDYKCEYLLRKKMFMFINIVAMVFFFVAYTIPSIRITQTYGIMYTRLYAFNSSEAHFGSTIKLFFAQQILYGLFLSSMMIGILELFNSDKKKILKTPTFLIGLGEMILYAYTFKGRAPIFITIFFVAVAYLLFFKWKKKEFIVFSEISLKKKIRLVVILLVVFMAIMSIARFDGFSQLKKFLIIYFGGQITYFSELIENSSVTYIPFRTIFCGLLDFIKLLLNSVLGIDFVLGSNEIGKLIDGSTLIGSGISINAGCTEIFYYYFEFGVLGIIVYSFLKSVVMSIIYNTSKAKDNKIWDMLYLCVLYTIYYSYSGWTLKYLYFWLMPLIVRIFYKKYVRKN